MHADSILAISKATGSKVPAISELVTMLIHTRGLARVVAVDHQDNSEVQLTPWAANLIRTSQGLPALRQDVK